jgi:uncharacterized membrane protein (UPF0127 family)
MKPFLTFVLMIGLVATAHAQQAPQTDLPRLQIQSGVTLINAQVAMSADERETGLMYRTQMPANEGMLFVFEQSQTQCFWMKNTLIPLTAAFINNNGVIVNLEDMQAQTTTAHCSATPVRFVLEMHQGWFAKRGIKAGSKLSASVFNH